MLRYESTFAVCKPYMRVHRTPLPVSTHQLQHACAYAEMVEDKRACHRRKGSRTRLLGDARVPIACHVIEASRDVTLPPPPPPPPPTNDDPRSEYLTLELIAERIPASLMSSRALS